PRRGERPGARPQGPRIPSRPVLRLPDRPGVPRRRPAAPAAPAQPPPGRRGRALGALGRQASSHPGGAEPRRRLGGFRSVAELSAPNLAEGGFPRLFGDPHGRAATGATRWRPSPPPGRRTTRRTTGADRAGREE